MAVDVTNVVPDEEVLPPQPTRRSMIIGEVVGSFMLAVLGLGIGISALLWSTPDSRWFADILPISAGWALTIALGIYVTNTLSGAHFNPAVTITLAATGRHEWRLVPLYLASQMVGWTLGAAVLALMFGGNLMDFARANDIRIGSPDSLGIASAFTTYSPNPGIAGAGPDGYTTVPFAVGMIGEILGTAILLLVILSLLETRHVNAPSAWFFPLIVGSTIGLLIMFVAPISQASFNPARDLGPRLVLLFMGFGEQAFPGPNNGLSLVVTNVGPIIGGVLGALFFDKVMRPNIPGVEQESKLTTLSQLAYDPTLVESRRGTLAGHAVRLPSQLFTRTADIDVVFVDVGGAVYDDDQWALAVMQALHEMSDQPLNEGDFWAVYDHVRQTEGSLSMTAAEHFAPNIEPAQLSERTMRRYTVPTSAILEDAQATLEALASRYRLVAVCHPREPQEWALRRDGLLRYFVATIGPDSRHPPPQMWTDTLAELGVEPSRAVHVGNRFDNDVVPAKAAGLKTVWLLRGEAPPAPTHDKLNEPDAVITTFAGVTEALVTIAEQRAGAR